MEHAETPSVVHVDVLGRPFRTVETPDGTEEYLTDTVLDLLGRTTAVIDARGNTTQADVYDAIGRTVHSTSPDAGETRVVSDVAGQPVTTWKSGSVVVTQTYDALRRPRATLDGTRVHVFNVYGEFDATEHALGRLWRQYDGAGLVELAYDFAGNVVSSTRTFLDDVDTEVDWVDLLDDADVATLDASAAGDLQGSGFTTTTTFDALKRLITSTTPDDSVTRNTWDEGGWLAAVDVQIRGSSTWTPMVGAIEHDAKGQRTRIEYPGFATDYTYDAETFRLVRLLTVRDSDDAVLQDLTYTYDAAGNIVQITDAAQQTLFFDNSVVSPTTKYKYDALYRLVSAEGREHGSLAQPAHGDPALGDLPHDNDGSSVRTYLETYVYDEVGNILRMKHQGGTEASPGSVLWHRGYLYDDDSNVLLKTSLPGDDVDDPDTYSATAYAVNARGAMTEMPHMAGITRQFDDQMRAVDLGGGDDAVYHYDAAGQRVRKVVRTGSTTKERLYLGAWERFQRSTTTLQEERDTLHVMDDRRRIVMIETLTVDGGSTVTTPVPRQRFQLGNHLDSAALEVDEDGALITYEEYHPFGTTSWWATASTTDVSQKRYRYTGKEKDEETGLAYHGARYYAAWLGRWERVDPAGMVDGPNWYAYVRGNPVGGRDPTGMGTREDGVDPDVDVDTDIPNDQDADLEEYVYRGGSAAGRALGAPDAIAPSSPGALITRPIGWAVGEWFENNPIARGELWLATEGARALGLINDTTWARWELGSGQAFLDDTALLGGLAGAARAPGLRAFLLEEGGARPLPPPGDPLLDNSVFSSLVRGDPQARVFAQRNVGLLSVVDSTYAEAVAKNAVADVEATMKEFAILRLADPPADAVAALQAEIKASPLRAGRNPTVLDTTVIAGARQYGIPMVTGDTRQLYDALAVGQPAKFRFFDPPAGPQMRIDIYNKVRATVPRYGADPWAVTGGRR